MNTIHLCEPDSESKPAYLGGFLGKRACPRLLGGEMLTKLRQKVASSPVSERPSASSSKPIDSELIGKWQKEMW